LAEQELKVVSLDHDICCHYRSGDTVKTIPLENITDCGLDARGSGVGNNCTGDLSVIYVDTASSGGKNGTSHEAMGLGLQNVEWFLQEVMNRRDVVKGAPVAQSMLRAPGDSKSTEVRIAEIQNLRDKGIITAEEYDTKRQEIIATI
jgi:hypothetical protein